MMDRRSFLRVALLGTAGAVTVAACPQFVEDLITQKSYFFFHSDAARTLIEQKMAEAAARMGEFLLHDLSLSGISADVAILESTPRGYDGWVQKEWKRRASRERQDEWIAFDDETTDPEPKIYSVSVELYG